MTVQNYTPTPFHVKLNGCTLHFHAATVTHIVEKTPDKMKTVSVRGGEHNNLFLAEDFSTFLPFTHRYLQVIS